MLKVRRTRRYQQNNNKVTLKNVDKITNDSQKHIEMSDRNIQLSKSLAKNEEIDDKIRSKLKNILHKISSYKDEINQSQLQKQIKRSSHIIEQSIYQDSNIKVTDQEYENKNNKENSSSVKKVKFSNKNEYHTFKEDEKIHNDFNHKSTQILKEKKSYDFNKNQYHTPKKKSYVKQHINFKVDNNDYNIFNKVQNDQNYTETTFSSNKHYRISNKSQNKQKFLEKVNQEYYIKDLQFKEIDINNIKDQRRKRYYSCQPQKIYSTSTNNYLEPVAKKVQGQNNTNRQKYIRHSVPPQFKYKKNQAIQNKDLLTFKQKHLDKYYHTNKLNFFKLYNKITQKNVPVYTHNNLKMTASFSNNKNLSYIHSNKASKLFNHIKNNLDNKKIEYYVNDIKKNARFKKINTTKNLEKFNQILIVIIKQNL